MKKILIPEFTVERPDSCDDCAFYSHGTEEGGMCVGMPIPTYKAPVSTGSNTLYNKPITSPEEALKHYLFCMFVTEED